MECPDCSSQLTQERKYLTDDEWTMIIDCPNCSFGFETESNLVFQDRYSTAVDTQQRV